MAEAWPGRIAAAFARQVVSCRDLGSPFTAGLLDLIGQDGLPDGAVRERIATWTGTPDASADALPLRLAGALHRLVLEGAAENLARCYPPIAESIDAPRLLAAVNETVVAQAPFICDYLDLPPQTNEVRRSAGIMAGLMVIAKDTGLPLSLFEIGSSAGLNLCPDLYCIDLGGMAAGDPASALRLHPDWQGPPPPSAVPRIVSRRGCDRNPLHPGNADDVMRLKSYTWADQKDRLERLDTALQIAGASSLHIDRADALEWLPGRLAAPAPDVCRVVFHSVVLQYFPSAARESFEALMAQAGAVATPDSPLAWLSCEHDGGDGAALTLTLWPGGERRDLGRADFHGRWVRWLAD